jgi:predicted TIM-barrel fold metal-dependent hydrolase
VSITDRSLVARIAAHERWAREPDRAAATAAARQANDDRYLNAARVLHPTQAEEELRIRAANLRSADAARMARARWGKKAADVTTPTAQEVDRVSDPTPTS